MNIEIKRLDAREGSCNDCHAGLAGTSGKVIKTVISVTFHVGNVGRGIRFCDSCFRSFMTDLNAANERFIQVDCDSV